MWSAAVHRVADCIIGRVVPEPTEWQHIGNQIDTDFSMETSVALIIAKTLSPALSFLTEPVVIAARAQIIPTIAAKVTVTTLPQSVPPYSVRKACRIMCIRLSITVANQNAVAVKCGTGLAVCANPIRQRLCMQGGCSPTCRRPPMHFTFPWLGLLFSLPQ